MRTTLRNASAIAAVLCLAGSATAQLVITPVQAQFGGRRGTSIFVQPRIAPFPPGWGSSNGYWTYNGGSPWNGGGWVYNPPPIVIQNFITPPLVGMPYIRGGGVVVPPPEFEAPAVKAPPKVPNLGPAPKPPEVIVPDPAKVPPPPPGRVEADRIVESGRKAFADGQHGRALELFRRAAEIMPNEPSVHFLVSQAQFARGKYREAVAAVASGMAIRGDWSEARFAPRDLYWKKPAVFDDHLQALRDAVAAYPDDAGLIFLLGHELWFDGKHDEAKAVILKARALAKGTPADAFVLK
jgi:Tetratricopeptide repeat